MQDWTEHGKFQCVLDDNHRLPEEFHHYHAPSVCRKSYTHSAYRRVPGDKCEGGWMPPFETLPCPNVSTPYFIKAIAVAFIIVIILLRVTKPNKQKKLTGEQAK